MKIPKEYVGPARETKGIKAQWWREQGNEIGINAFGVASKIRENQNYRRSDNLNFARLYSNAPMIGLQSTQYARVSPQERTQKVTFNVVASCIDAVTAKIAKNKPRPMFLTSGGDWKTKSKAKKLTKFIDGLFDEIRLYQKGAQCFVDSCVFGTGVVYFYAQDSEIRAERVLPDEILIDDAEGLYGEPRQLHRIKSVHRDILREKFKSDKQALEAIASAGPGFPGETTSEYAADMLGVVESWHLPSGPNAKDGMRCVSIENYTLVQEPYTKDYFPFAFLRWTPKLFGFYGAGLCEALMGIQQEINVLLNTIQRAMKRASVPRVFVENSSQVNTNHINNEIGGVIKYAGKPPVFDTAQAMNAEVYAHLDRLYAKAFEIAGVSQLSAQSKKPTGLDSSVALREFNDIESERFAITGQRYEQWYIDSARICVDLAKDLYSEKKNLTVRAAGKKFLEEIKWSEVDLPADSYIMRCFPTSILPSVPAGRMAFVQEMIQGGFMDKEEGRAVLDFPDLERSMSLATAAYDDCMHILESIIDEGIYTTPEPYMNPQLCVKLGQSQYLRARSEKVPEERLELLRRFIDDANSLVQDKAQSQAPAASLTPAAAFDPAAQAPAAIPAPLPVSDLLPQTPQPVI